jgi:hypothetical protein
MKDILAPDQAYEGLYGQGPPSSVHSSHGRAFQQGMCFVLFYLENKREKTTNFSVFLCKYIVEVCLFIYLVSCFSFDNDAKKNQKKNVCLCL